MKETTSGVQPKWSEITLLPEWEEPHCLVYRAKKHGKWVMLKCLKPEYAGRQEYEETLEREFDARYNLAHPNIVMINDFEEIPGLGRCIITDYVYGPSLRQLIDEKKITPQVLASLQHQLIDAMEYIQANHIVHRPLRPEMIIFTENIGNLKLIDVGFEQKKYLEPEVLSEDIYNYGRLLGEVLDAVPAKMPHLRRIALRCADPVPSRRYHDVQDLHLALEKRSSNQLYVFLIVFLIIMLGVLAWLNWYYRPAHKAPSEEDWVTRVVTGVNRALEVVEINNFA